MKKFCLLLLFVALFSASCSAQEKTKPVDASSFEKKTFKTMPYRLSVPPNYDKTKKYPLVLWLHGAWGRGNDNERQIIEGNTLGATIWTRAENQTKNPVFVLAPQCALGEWWANNDSEMKPSSELEKVVELLKELQKQYSIDADRLYVTGQSMGGYGTWSIVTEYPEMFAAAIPLCGGGSASRAKNLINVPIWAFHGDADDAVDVEKSREMIEAIKKAGGNPKYTEYKDVGHSVWHQAFAEPELLNWVFAQKRNQKK
jgi:predicted peptidase